MDGDQAAVKVVGSMTEIETSDVHSGVELAGFSGSPTVALDPAMPAIDGFRAVLANLADTIAANWQGTIAQIISVGSGIGVGPGREESIVVRSLV